MVGSGVFSLPATFADATGPFGALIAWTIAGFGMLSLAFVFQTLAVRKPDLDAGIFAYPQAGFGDYLGFVAAFGFWAASCLGNVTYFVLIKSTLGQVWPVFGDGDTPAAMLTSSALLWLFHFMILRGVKEAAGVNVIVTIAKIIPIALFIVILVGAFQADLFTYSFWGGEAVSWRGVAGQVRRTMLVTVFASLQGGLKLEPAWNDGQHQLDGVFPFMRPMLRGNLFRDWIDYRLSFEVATGDPFVLDAFIGVLAASIGHHTEHFFEFVASLVASAVSVAGAHWWGADPAVTTLAGLVMLIPGFGLTLAISELALRELVSGTARLMSALIVFVEMGLGTILARRLLPDVPSSPIYSHSLEWWVADIALVGPLVAFIVLFRVPKHAIFVMVLACVTGFYGARFGARLLGPEVGPWLGAVGIGVVSNAYARAFSRPATIPLVPAVVLLVPGALSLRGLSAIIEEGQMMSGMQMMTSALLIAASIVVGLLTANTLVPARRIL